MDNSTVTSPISSISHKHTIITVLLIFVIGLIASQAWTIVQLKDTQSSLDKAIEVIDGHSGQISKLQSTLNSQESQISGLISDLSYVSSLAENANQWAHTHY